MAECQPARAISIAVVASPDTKRDELYLTTQRFIDGQERRYVEYMTKTWETEDEQEDAVHLDCSWTVVNESPSSEVTGLWHLEGEEISVYVDGKKHVNATVTNGKVTLGHTGTIVTLGYAYNSDLGSLPVDGGAQDGSSQGKTKRISRLGLWLMDTLGLKYGPDADNLTEIKPRTWGEAHGEATPLFTGVVRERFEGDYDRLGQYFLRADGPFPATVLAAMPQFQVSDDS